jgi:hypothetical protein
LKETKALRREALFALHAAKTLTRQIRRRAWHNSNCINVNLKESGPMDSFDKYDEIDYTGKSDPDIWETHLEFFLSKQTALRRYAEIKRLHPEAAKKTAVRPFFRSKGEIKIHPDMIRDLDSENLETAKGVWQFEYWLPSTEKQAVEYEGRMSAKDPTGWTVHRGRAKRQMGEPSEQS